ncbi:unnamed protein product [Schistosoma curassoni]|uniref:BTB domain-containing protein n=1 Tax=Schistosoma curassoni TaxID=6186 RepID=A0A183KTN7_9TREM|nr:unnamed protein product [Schistosoma curassoni]
MHQPITIDGEDLDDMKTFTYLGSIIDEQGGSDADMLTRIGKARAAYLQLKNMWNSKQLSTNTKQLGAQILCNYSFKLRRKFLFIIICCWKMVCSLPQNADTDGIWPMDVENAMPILTFTSAFEPPCSSMMLLPKMIEISVLHVVFENLGFTLCMLKPTDAETVDRLKALDINFS